MLFNYIEENKARLRQYQELVEGCKKHPAYRYKRKPTAKCKRCEELFAFYSQLKEWDEKSQKWWRTYHSLRIKEQEEESRQREERLNCPG